MEIISGGVTSPKGFSAWGLRAGIKAGKTNRDMAMIKSDVLCNVAGVYTKNLVKAAPVKWDKEITDKGVAQAVVVNTGIANACTGKQGTANTEKTAEFAALALGMPKDNIIVASTGVIGAQLPMGIIEKGVKELSNVLSDSKEASDLAAEAIMTTDTKPKQACVSLEVDGKHITIGGMCKGSGMIHPHMGTMLGFITTDCCISSEMLRKALKKDVEDSFNMVSVDGDTSTNDTVVILANGLAENTEITSEGEAFDKFCRALSVVTKSLAMQIAADGEGATTLLEVAVQGAPTQKDAKVLAKSVAGSSLTKAAIFGRDANWGRILCALGYSGASFDPDSTDIYIESQKGKIQLVSEGVATDYSEDKATQIMTAEKVTIHCILNSGDFSATAWGCDLTHEYVNINADYRS